MKTVLRIIPRQSNRPRGNYGDTGGDFNGSGLCKKIYPVAGDGYHPEIGKLHKGKFHKTGSIVTVPGIDIASYDLRSIHLSGSSSSLPL